MTRLSPRRFLDVHQAVGRSSRRRQYLAQRRAAERRVACRRLGVARVVFRRHHGGRSQLLLRITAAELAAGARDDPALVDSTGSAAGAASRPDARPISQLRRDDVRRAAHRAARQPPRTVEPPRAAVPDRAACSLGDHSMLWEFLEHHHHVSYQSHVRPLHIVWMATAALLAGAAWRWKTAESKDAESTEHASHLSHADRTYCTPRTYCTCRTCCCSPSSS